LGEEKEMRCRSWSGVEEMGKEMPPPQTVAMTMIIELVSLSMKKP
jgi:hypothetical protein